MPMDCIRAFDVELDRPVYYAGEVLTGHVYVEAEENMRMQNIKVFLRGKAHAEWKITRAGERRTVKQDEHYIDERILVWGKEEGDSHQGISILTRGRHRYPFHFQLPETALPCSFESKIGTIRYYVRVHLNIPYASCPQCIRYFTIIGPNIDCMDERFLSPVSSFAKRNSCSLCCGKGPLLLRATLERTSYVCGEQIKLKAEVQNGSDSEVWVLCKVIQYVEFFINKGVLGLSKEVRHTVLEAESDKVPAHDTSRLDELMGRLVVPIMPPTMIEVCGLVQIYYTLKLYLETSKGKGDAAEISLPLTIATVPFRVPNHPMPDIHYEIAASNVEGGMYISPEFQLGQVYMGDEVDPETDQTILYRPVYVCVSDERPPSRTDAHLLQVPSRQMGRSRENVGGSREEGLQVQENIVATHSMQQQMKMFQVTSDDGSGASAKPAKPEDKFLKEITAKIANRQYQMDEAGAQSGLCGGDGASHQTGIEAHVELMRKQKKSNDIVHKALVNELRRHLSDGEDGVEVEKVPQGLKKPVGVKKVSGGSGATDPSKRLKTDSEREVMLHAESSSVSSTDVGEQIAGSCPSKSQAFAFSAQSFSISHTMEKDARVEAVSEDQVEEIECSELSALLSTSTDNIQMDIDEKKSGSRETSPGHDRFPDYKGAMQQSLEELPPPPPPPPEQEYLAEQSMEFSSELVFSEGKEELIRAPTPVREGGAVRVTGSPRRIIDNITPAAIAATVTAAAPAYADPSPTRKVPTPQVAPKPKQKDRHSFPAAQPVSGDSSSESSSLNVQIATRPKSEVVKHEEETPDIDDSVV